MTKKRIPQVGDRVFANGHNGAFVVMEVNAENQTVKLSLIGRDGPTMPKLQVGWHDVSFPSAQDASQAAARIVREATEDH
jgi:hypothetical protein